MSSPSPSPAYRTPLYVPVTIASDLVGMSGTDAHAGPAAVVPVSGRVPLPPANTAPPFCKAAREVLSHGDSRAARSPGATGNS